MSWHMAFEELLRQKFCLFDPWWSTDPMFQRLANGTFLSSQFCICRIFRYSGLVTSSLPNRKVQRPHRPDAPQWSKRLTHLIVVAGQKKKNVTLTDRTSSILFSFNVIFFQSGCHPHTWTTNTETSHYYESCGLGTSPPLGTMILRKLSTVNITARLWTCQCRIHHLTSNSCNVIMDCWSQSAIEKWSRTAARRRKRSIFGTFGSYGIWWKLDES